MLRNILLVGGCWRRHTSPGVFIAFALLRYILYTHVQTCDDVRVQSATQWTASVHTLHMSKPVMTFVVSSATQWAARTTKREVKKTALHD